MKPSLADRFEAVAGLASAVSAYAASQGIDAAPIARACGLDPERFDIVGERVSLDRMARFMEALALIAADDLFGLKSASMFEKGASGPFGYALMNAPTLRDGLVFIGRNLNKITETSICTLEIGAREVHFDWTYSPLILHRTQYVDMTTAQMMAHARTLIGPDIGRTRLELERPKPANPGLHRQILVRNISFNAPINSFSVPTELLDRQNPKADRRLFAIMAQQVEAMQVHQTDSGDPVAAVRLYVAENLAPDAPTLAQAADRLGMSERTLQRRLTEAGTSLQAIVDECRKEMAERLLSETSLTLSQISYKLGFSAPGAFTRSSIRWFGATPSQVRQGQTKPRS